MIWVFIITAFVFLFCLSQPPHHNEPNWYVVIILYFLVCGAFLYIFNGEAFCVFNSKECVDKMAADNKQKEATHAEWEGDCKTAEYITQSPNGVKLYKIRCSGRDVFFSGSGTHTTHEECSGGKAHQCHTVDDNVTNSGEN